MTRRQLQQWGHDNPEAVGRVDAYCKCGASCRGAYPDEAVEWRRGHVGAGHGNATREQWFPVVMAIAKSGDPRW